MWACRKAMSKIWEMKPNIALWLYEMVLLPKLMYAAVMGGDYRVEIRVEITHSRAYRAVT